ncbi:hypothetical protein ACFL2D_01625 [Patescibacteria group bacterium]
MAVKRATKTTNKGTRKGDKKRMTPGEARKILANSPLIIKAVSLRNPEFDGDDSNDDDFGCTASPCGGRCRPW